MMAEDIQIHRSGCGLEYITLAERAMKNNQGGLNISESKATRSAFLQLSCVS